jgi:hypothetical protein
MNGGPVLRAENRRVLARRFPAVLAWIEAAPAVAEVEAVEGARAPTLKIRGVQLEGAVDPRAEAELQARLVPAGASEATVYGIAQGTLVRRLLERPSLARLRVVVLDPAVAGAVLERLGQDDWLADERVELVRPEPLAELDTPFAALPAELALAGEEGARLRDLVRRELATPFLRSRLEEQQEEVAARVRANAELVRRDGDVAGLAELFPGRTVWIASAGPSLAEHYAKLRSAEQPLIAVDAALRPLLVAGIVPDYVVSIDPHAEGVRRMLDLADDRLRDVTLVYFPCLDPATLARWPGRRLAALGREPVYDELRGDSQGSDLWASGSVFHAAADLAVRMGASRVELHGADFATPRGRSHVAGAAWERSLPRGMLAAWVVDGHGERILSMPNLVGYLRDFERYVRDHPEVEFVNASKSGARIEGVPVLEDARAS